MTVCSCNATVLVSDTYQITFSDRAIAYSSYQTRKQSVKRVKLLGNVWCSRMKTLLYPGVGDDVRVRKRVRNVLHNTVVSVAQDTTSIQHNYGDNMPCYVLPLLDRSIFFDLIKHVVLNFFNCLFIAGCCRNMTVPHGGWYKGIVLR